MTFVYRIEFNTLANELKESITSSELEEMIISGVLNVKKEKDIHLP